jgi:RNA polymerase subunit RPABC4/transcription elongation factor Spt4
MDSAESDYQCSECGTNVPIEAKICPNCGVSLEEVSEEENFIEIPISSEPSTIATIQSLLQENNIEYSINDNALENVWGPSFTQFPRLLVRKDQAELANDIIDSFEEENVEILDTEVFQEEDSEKGEQSVPLIGVKGWLLLFCISLIFIDPIISLPLIILYVINTNNPLNYYPLLHIILNIDVILNVLILLLGIYVGITIWILRPNAIRYANLFLNAYLGYTILSFLIFFTVVPSYDIDYNSATVGFFSDTFRGTIYSIGYVIIWKLYLKKSERVKNTFPAQLN